MLAPSRRLASLAYALTMLGTLLSIFVWRLRLLSLLFIVLQVEPRTLLTLLLTSIIPTVYLLTYEYLIIVLQSLALVWYCLSYIPYGQAAAKALVRSRATHRALLPHRALSPQRLADSVHCA